MALLVAETMYSSVDRNVTGEHKSRYDVEEKNTFTTAAFKPPASCS
jgi:hypothetical protein